jgi:26S proteasome regulatory subunit N5
MALSGDVYLKMNRPAGIINFEQPRAVEEVLSDWANDIGSLMNLMESTCHLILR